MPTTSRIVVGLAAAALMFSGPGPVSADLVKLKNGGEVRGTLRSSDEPEPHEPVVVESLSGTVVAVAPQEVQFIAHRPKVVEEYETRAKRIPDTIDAHWKLARWCREHGLHKQRKAQLEHILQINPDHRLARLSLGYNKYNGRWMTKDEWNRSRGLVKHKGRYITPEELDLIKKSEAEREREREWFPKVRLWKAWLTSQNAERQQNGLKALRSITSPNAVAALSQNFADESDKRLRFLFVKILSGIKGNKPVPALVARSLHDSEREIRYAALNGLSENQYTAAMGHYIRALKNESVAVVRRAADGLKRAGDERAVPALIEALTTTHLYKVRVPDNSRTYSFGTNGSFGGNQSVLPPNIELMLRTGQFPHGVIINNPQRNQARPTKVVTVRYTHKNRPVLAALEAITGKSFGYNARNWRLWLASSKNKPALKSP